TDVDLHPPIFVSVEANAKWRPSGVLELPVTNVMTYGIGRRHAYGQIDGPTRSDAGAERDRGGRAHLGARIKHHRVSRGPCTGADVSQAPGFCECLRGIK